MRQILESGDSMGVRMLVHPGRMYETREGPRALPPYKRQVGRGCQRGLRRVIIEVGGKAGGSRSLDGVVCISRPQERACDRKGVCGIWQLGRYW